MTETSWKNAMAIGILSSVIGVLLIFFNVDLGTTMAASWLVSESGVDPETYNVVLDSYITNFLVIGSIVFSFGLIMITFSSYQLLIIREKG
ncbi:hypothetical protein [Halobacillus mangrovi]|uniref:Uncharacterized protein n=1 Tax=Halobacillus mangrovi TaxID=402384 RepID=A0A1W5ZX89_9BACI|nr:hypothetical protein [Halobacillus mangrovi]ARI77946.1 hypothetical protein HM131_14290 [Halobacillus mangrovi]